MTNEILSKLENRKFKRNYSPPEESVIFSISDQATRKTHVIGSLCSFVTFVGLPKAGKSLYITSAIASAFTTWDIFGMKINFPPGRKRLAYIDTESSDFDFYKVLDRISSQIICNQLPDNFDAFLFREDPPHDIQQMIENYLINSPECSVLVIDGILDLIADFNSVEQSFYLVQWLKQITKRFNLLLLCVLHLGKKDQHSIGHIGSFLDRKSQSVLIVQKNKEQKTIDLLPGMLRSTDDFNPLQIQHNGNQWNQVNASPQTETDHVYGMEKKQILYKILAEPKGYNQLVVDLSEFTGKSLTTCKKILRKWIQEETIRKVGDLYKMA